MLPDIVDNPYYGEPVLWFGLVFHGDALSNRVLAGPERSSYGLADNHHAWRAAVVLVGKSSSLQESNSHYSEIVRAHVRLGDVVIARQLAPAIEGEISLNEDRLERHEIHRTRVNHPWQI